MELITQFIELETKGKTDIIDITDDVQQTVSFFSCSSHLGVLALRKTILNPFHLTYDHISNIQIKT